jgi:hypothetical protein
LALAAIIGAAGCGNAVPPFPTYSKDIKPLMEAHCVRCHGAGGTLNADPDITPAPDGSAAAAYDNVGAPARGYFTQLADLGPGKLGLMSYATTAKPLMLLALPYMPPPPAPPLTQYEHDLLMAWLNEPNPLP